MRTNLATPPAPDGRTPRRPGRSSLFLLAAASTLLAYGGAEVVYRVLRHHQMASGEATNDLWVLDEPLWRFDAETGFRYRPGARSVLRHVAPDGTLIRENRVTINAQGQRAPRDLPARPADGEWRIAVLGNSFAAGINQNRDWPSRLEERLAADDELLARLGRRSVRVANLGLDGTGITQWLPLAERTLTELQPDLVLVDFIADDIARRFIWRRMQPLPSGDAEILLISASLPVDLANPDCVFGRMLVVPDPANRTPEAIGRIRESVLTMEVDRLPWWSLRPALVAELARGRFGLDSPFRRGGLNPRHDDEREAVDRSAAALRAIVALHPHCLVLHHPGWQEVLDGKRPGAVDALEREAEVPIVRMLERLPGAPEPEKRGWFLLPHDGHHSDAGNRVYAAAVHELLGERIE